MRVISGSARATKLRTLDLPHLRPMLDRVKEALFNIIRDSLEGARVLDLFSGCGALGIEALSRGAASCLFVENDPKLVRLLGQNVAKCHLSERSEVLQADVFSLPRGRPAAALLPADLVFVDPPYAFVDDPNRRAQLFESLEQMAAEWIRLGAVVMLHHEPMPYALWPTRLMECFDRRIYGRSQITLFDVRGGPEREEEASGGPS